MISLLFEWAEYVLIVGWNSLFIYRMELLLTLKAGSNILSFFHKLVFLYIWNRLAFLKIAIEQDSFKLFFVINKHEVAKVINTLNDLATFCIYAGGIKVTNRIRSTGSRS